MASLRKEECTHWGVAVLAHQLEKLKNSEFLRYSIFGVVLCNILKGVLLSENTSESEKKEPSPVALLEGSKENLLCGYIGSS